MSEDIDEQAAIWLQQQGRDDMDWTGFTAWLEADARHREAFDAIALLEEDVARVRTALVSARATETVSAVPGQDRRRWRGPALGGMAAAVALVAAVGGGLWLRPGPVPSEQGVSYSAEQGKTRAIALANGVNVVLGSSSRLVAAANNRLAMSGGGYFDVRHDPARPLSVTIGGFEVRDIGTRFEINSDAQMVHVAVAEGAVSVTSPSGAIIRISAGQSALGNIRTGVLDQNTISASSIGAWRSGPFIYDQMPLGLVAADIARYTGHRVIADQAIAQRKFSGILAPGDRDAMVKSVAALAGVRSRKEGDAVFLGDGASD